MYVCMYVRTYVCMHVGMYVRTYTNNAYIHTSIRTYVCIYVCMHVCMDIYLVRTPNSRSVFMLGGCMYGTLTDTATRYTVIFYQLRTKKQINKVATNHITQ